MTVKTVNNATLGMILVDAKRKTLYRYTDDQPNVGNCYDQCAQNWPPLLVSTGKPYLAGGVAGRLGTITRADGGKQITYAERPPDHARPGLAAAMAFAIARAIS